MSRLLPLCVSLLSVFVSSAGWADTTMTAESRTHGTPETGSIYIQSGKAGFASGAVLDGFFDSQRRVLVVLDHKEKTYTEITEAFGKKMSHALGAMAKMMESATAGMTEEQKQAMAGMMGGMMPKTPAAAVRYSLRDSGESARVLGIPCSNQHVYKNDIQESEVCIASLAAAGIDAGDYQTLLQFAEFAASMAESLPFSQAQSGQAAAVLTQANGVPLRIRSEAYQMQIQAIKPNVPKGLFTIPATYTKTDIMSQIGHLGAR